MATGAAKLRRLRTNWTLCTTLQRDHHIRLCAGAALDRAVRLPIYRPRTVAAGPNERGLVFVPPTLRAPPRNPYAATKRARPHSLVGRRLPEAGIARLLLQT
jgi:hypothetical protein